MPIITTLISLIGASLYVFMLTAPVDTPDGRSLTTGLGCHDGSPIYYRPFDYSPLGDPDATAEEVATDTHELAHAYDCVDDGQLNGSPGHPRPVLYRDAIRILGIEHNRLGTVRYCWWGGDGSGALYPHAEWYACMVEATGRVR